MMARRAKWLFLIFGSAAAAGLATAPALAQNGADFYKGKTVNYIVATAPGGG